MATSAEKIVLPSHVVPLRYDLELEPDLKAFTFQGKVAIEFKVNRSLFSEENSKVVTLHAKELLFESATLKASNQDLQTASQINVNIKDHTVQFVFDQPLCGPNEGTEETQTIALTIVFKGFLNNQMAGFYRSSYSDIHGNTQVMASTQFEALDARRCFPCVDEPAVKAIFGLKLTVDSHLTCLSNMPEQQVSCIPKTNRKTVTFFDTPTMSTYLLAFVVGEFDFVQQKTEHGVWIKVWTPVGKTDAGRFALDCACRALDKYDDFFDTPYPLPKLDMVAITEFAAGAMENWGLVTYREVDLLIDPITASSQQKQRVAVVVTHELAHQWFGNLVTMEWWNGLWLNESFASWGENWATDQLFPEYKMWDQFVTGSLAAALRLDALKSSHPIDVPIRHAEEVEQVFDSISYCKGAAVVRMVQAVLGFNNFQKGLQQYMKDYAYGNTEAEHLWKAWEAVSGMPVQELMGNWTHQMGFPLLKVVKEDWSEQGDKVTLQLEQQWFLSDGSPLQGDEEIKKTWTIPVMTCTQEGQQADMTLMREQTATVTVEADSGKKVDWVKFNAGQEVPMRVLPSPGLLERYGAGIASGSMKPMDRAGLLNDAYALVKAGHLKPEALIQLIGHYKNEEEYVVWEGLASVLSGLNSLLSGSDDEALTTNFRKFANKLVVNSLGKIGWESSADDGHLTTLLRGLVIGLLSSFAYDDKDVAAEAAKRFEAFQKDHTDMQSLPSDMRTAVFQILMKNGGKKEYDAVKSYFYTAPDNAEKKHVLSSLGCIQDPALKLATMEFACSGEIKLQDFFYAMGSVSRSGKVGRDIAWKYFQDNFEMLQSMLAKASSHLMDACIVFCCGSFCSDAKADEIEAFFKAHPVPKNSRKIEQTTEHMRANAKFLQVLLSSNLATQNFWDDLM